MTAPLPVPAPAGAPPPQAQLRKASQQMEGLFYGQLLQSMRAALPKGGALAASTGEEMFTSMLDDKIADLAASHSQRGLGDALYRQLSARLPHPAPATSTAGTTNAIPR